MAHKKKNKARKRAERAPEPNYVKTPQEIVILREGGRKLAAIIESLSAMVMPGVDTRDIDVAARRLAIEHEARPSFLNYKPRGNWKSFPAAICISVNEVIVHGIPGAPEYVIKEGDLVTLDMGLEYKGLYTDHAITYGVGKISRQNSELIAATEQAMMVGIEAVKPGVHVGDIGFSIQTYAQEVKLELAQNLAGHGVGYAVHEDPLVPNEGYKGHGEELVPGMVLAIEPMLVAGKGTVEFMEDEFTVVTKDRKHSAHFEHTVVVTDKGYEILTQL